MKKVLLSADNEVKVYLVPDTVAENLNEYCWEFAANWLWKDPRGSHLLKNIRGQTVAVFSETDFIDYLNTWIFPDQPSVMVENLGWVEMDTPIPEKYRDCPDYNF